MVKRSALHPKCWIRRQQRGDGSDHHRRGHQDQWGEREDPAGPFGSHPLAVGQFPQVEEGLSHRWPDPSLDPTTDLAHQPDEQWAPDSYADDLEQRNCRRWTGPTSRTSCHHHQDDDQGRHAEGQVAVHAPVGHSAGDGPPTAQHVVRRIVEPPFEGIVQRRVEGRRLDVVAGFRHVAHIDVVGRREDVLEHPGERLAERCRGVLHGRRLEFPAAPPGLDDAHRTRLEATPCECDRQYRQLPRPRRGSQEQARCVRPRDRAASRGPGGREHVCA